MGGVSSRTHRGHRRRSAELDEEAQEEEEQDILNPGNPDMDYDEAAFAAELEASQKRLPVRHVVHMEPLESRAQEMVIEAMQRTLIKFRAMGIATNRLHSDRAKELLSRQMRKWCATMGILQTFTAGDDMALKRPHRVRGEPIEEEDPGEAGGGRLWTRSLAYGYEVCHGGEKATTAGSFGSSYFCR